MAPGIPSGIIPTGISQLTRLDHLRLGLINGKKFTFPPFFVFIYFIVLFFLIGSFSTLTLVPFNVLTILQLTSKTPYTIAPTDMSTNVNFLQSL